MDTSKLMTLGIAAAALYAAYRFVPNAAVKAAVLGAAGTAVVMQLPYVKAIYTTQVVA